MNEEIKEILKDDDELLVRYKDGSFIAFDTLTIDVIDYITNLQQENEDNLKCIESLKKQLESVIKNNQELLEKWHKNNDKIVNLISENEKLKDIVVEKDSQLKELIIQKTDYTTVNILEMKLEDYKSRNEKAIEYYKQEKNNKCININGRKYYSKFFVDNIYYKLQGKSDE